MALPSPNENLRRSKHRASKNARKEQTEGKNTKTAKNKLKAPIMALRSRMKKQRPRKQLPPPKGNTEKEAITRYKITVKKEENDEAETDREQNKEDAEWRQEQLLPPNKTTPRKSVDRPKRRGKKKRNNRN